MDGHPHRRLVVYACMHVYYINMCVLVCMYVYMYACWLQKLSKSPDLVSFFFFCITAVRFFFDRGGWEAIWAEEHRKYYYCNRATGEAQWVRERMTAELMNHGIHDLYDSMCGAVAVVTWVFKLRLLLCGNANTNAKMLNARCQCQF